MRERQGSVIRPRWRMRRASWNGALMTGLVALPIVLATPEAGSRSVPLGSRHRIQIMKSGSCVLLEPRELEHVRTGDVIEWSSNIGETIRIHFPVSPFRESNFWIAPRGKLARVVIADRGVFTAFRYWTWPNPCRPKKKAWFPPGPGLIMEPATPTARRGSANKKPTQT